MGWKDLSYKVKGMIVAAILVVLLGLGSLINVFYLIIYIIALPITIPAFVLFGFFIGWIIDSVRKKDSFMKILLLVASAYLLAVCAALMYLCGRFSIPCFFEGYNSNAWIAMAIPCMILLVIGVVSYFANKSRRAGISSKEFLRPLIILIIIILLLPLMHYATLGKDGSYLEWATTFDKPELCEKIIGIGNRDFCYDFSAGKMNDTSYCEKITNSLTKGNCYADFFRWRGYDASVCNLTRDEEAKDICFASSTRNGQDCGRIQDVDRRDNCYKNYGGSFFTDNGSNLSYCSKVISVEVRDSCFKFIASLEKNINLGLCEEIQTQEIKEDCYVTDAWKKQDVSICDKIMTPKTRQHCLSQIRQK